MEKEKGENGGTTTKGVELSIKTKVKVARPKEWKAKGEEVKVPQIATKRRVIPQFGPRRLRLIQVLGTGETAATVFMSA